MGRSRAGYPMSKGPIRFFVQLKPNKKQSYVKKKKLNNLNILYDVNRSNELLSASARNVSSVVLVKILS